MEFRIGINMGDVVKEDGNLYGQAGGTSIQKTSKDKFMTFIVHAFDINTEKALVNLKEKKQKI